MAQNGQTKALIGAAVGAGGSTVSAIAVRQIFKRNMKMLQWSEAIGMGVGVAAGAAMLLLSKKNKGWKQAGYVTMLSAFLANGLRQIELMAFAPSVPGGMGIVDIERATALQDAVVDPTTVLQGSDMPQLVGATLEAANQHVQLVGAPALAEHAGSWGATLFNR
jgi:hypothetical protein